MATFKGYSKSSGYKATKKDLGSQWHSIGAGRVGDNYKGGKIVEIDAKNARAKVVKSKALKNRKNASSAKDRKWLEDNVPY